MVKEEYVHHMFWKVNPFLISRFLFEEEHTSLQNGWNLPWRKRGTFFLAKISAILERGTFLIFFTNISAILERRTFLVFFAKIAAILKRGTFLVFFAKISTILERGTFLVFFRNITEWGTFLNLCLEMLDFWQNIC